VEDRKVFVESTRWLGDKSRTLSHHPLGREPDYWQSFTVAFLLMIIYGEKSYRRSKVHPRVRSIYHWSPSMKSVGPVHLLSNQPAGSADADVEFPDSDFVVSDDGISSVDSEDSVSEVDEAMGEIRTVIKTTDGRVSVLEMEIASLKQPRQEVQNAHEKERQEEIQAKIAALEAGRKALEEAVAQERNERREMVHTIQHMAGHQFALEVDIATLKQDNRALEDAVKQVNQGREELMNKVQRLAEQHSAMDTAQARLQQGAQPLLASTNAFGQAWSTSKTRQ
jgi:predicted  nucleic acid-binding Zn-ribbon protein